ncbi:GMP synthase (glutamine-hydrolyzing) [Sporothrix schenckii 1099-18]|uniref:Glutamine amidotransferase domain-containing protein n=2 Tax=Sporothrix schenckii TaxID=29908 RepID=U7Q9G9_SPOS1|nr:GMP synthase (glutamine-hydrolyzing) [Sporothrix schenckii 1099-18]ERT03391.1 hypothetical protein HMPREF1624_01705 [Sporothrix schenckii ATCC 58251]KJR84161.1 GMP synthase (glutamine-hydrolysing) [Sporothrix schenckii 1099-18]
MGSNAASAPLRMAILMADTPLPKTAATYGTYGGVFIDLFRRAVAPSGASVESVLAITTHDVVADGFESAYPDLAQVDVVLITGSKHTAFDDTPWIQALVAFTQRTLATTTPEAKAAGVHPVRMLGICFGHQIIGRALGAPVTKGAKGWEVSVTDVTLSPEGVAFFGSELRAADHSRLAIQQMHRDIVVEYPAGAVPLASTDVCAVQGMLLPGRAVTVQGHPEFTGPIVREILEARHAMGVLSDDVYQKGIDVVDDKHDGEAIARAFLKFAQGA